MQKPNKSEKPDFKGAIRQQTITILPIDDPRNNARFRVLHPHVKFEGYSDKKKNKKDNAVSRQRPEPTQQKSHLSALAINISQIASPAMQDPVKSSAETHNDNNNVDDEDQVGGYMFHEIADESYSLDLDSIIKPTELTVPNRVFEGFADQENSISAAVPTNLSVSEITVADAENKSTDGVPTYMATLSFDASDALGDYEIRIVKA